MKWSEPFPARSAGTKASSRATAGARDPPALKQSSWRLRRGRVPVDLIGPLTMIALRASGGRGAARPVCKRWPPDAVHVGVEGAEDGRAPPRRFAPCCRPRPASAAALPEPGSSAWSNHLISKRPTSIRRRRWQFEGPLPTLPLYHVPRPTSTDLCRHILVANLAHAEGGGPVCSKPCRYGQPPPTSLVRIFLCTILHRPPPVGVWSCSSPFWGHSYNESAHDSPSPYRRTR